MLLQHIWIFFTSFLLLLNLQTQGSEETCMLEVIIYRNTNISTSEGESLTLNCPVKYCPDKEAPTVSWCKRQGQDCTVIGNTTEGSVTWTAQHESSGTASFTIPSVNISDNGSYACIAQYGEQQAQSHYMHLFISEKKGRSTTTISQSALNGDVAPMNGNFWSKNMWLLYFFIGLILVVTAICFILCCSVITRKAKKTSQEMQPKEVKKNCSRKHRNQKSMTVKFSRRTNKDSVVNNNSASDFFSESHEITIYDNDPCTPNQIISAQSTDKYTIYSNEDLGGNNSEPIVYAALQHSMTYDNTVSRPKRTHEEPTEYATLHLQQ